MIAQLLNTSTAQPLLRVRLGFGEPDDFATFFPLAALLEQFDAFETLQNIALRDDRAGSSKAAMLRHRGKMSAKASAKPAKIKCEPPVKVGSSEPRVAPKSSSGDKYEIARSTILANGECGPSERLSRLFADRPNVA